jgi:hypothetical protein
MKKLLIIALTSAFTFAGNVQFNYKTADTDAYIKAYIVETLNTNCASVFDDEETVVTVVDLEVDQIDQGMELEYKATVEVVADYGHSGAETIVIEFDEERYHDEGFFLYNITASAANLCK